MQKISLPVIFLFILAVYTSCKSKAGDEETIAKETMVETPVTVTSVTPGPLTEYIELNATSAFLQNNIVKASVNGYLKSVTISPGQYVPVGRIIFSIQTKESTNIGAIINNLDSSYRFSGTTNIKAAQAGYITQLNHQVGDYVQDGEQLAAISTSNSFGFLLNVPYDLKRYVIINKVVEIDLPDGSQLTGNVASIMPAMDSVSQTQRVLIRVNAATRIPENLIAKVKIMKAQKQNALSLPKEAVLSDESQTSFWIMKLIDSVTAVKIPITKGIEADGKVEILQPVLSQGDQVLISGNYGLADTAKVKIMKPE
ncbi:MAG: efflux RND transporter periplasmic adaptor subunit [Bacteroidota bacterium]